MADHAIEKLKTTIRELTRRVKRSMSRKADPWDNAVIESFFSTLPVELLSRQRFERFEDARRTISE